MRLLSLLWSIGILGSLFTFQALGDTAPASSTTTAPGQPSIGVQESIGLWAESARAGNVKPQLIAEVSRLIEQGSGKIPAIHPLETGEALRTSFKHLLESTILTTQKGELNYWPAYCVLEALAREPLDPTVAKTILDDYSKISESAIGTIKEELRSHLPAEERESLSKKIDESCDLLEKKLKDRIALLHSDNLFPGVKQPVTAKVKEEIARHFKTAAFYPDFRVPPLMKDPSKIHRLHIAALNNFFSYAEDAGAFYITAPAIEARLTPTKYWGLCSLGVKTPKASGPYG